MAETVAGMVIFWRKRWLPWWLFVRDVAAHVSTYTQRNAAKTRRLYFIHYEQSEDIDKRSIFPEVTTLSLMLRFVLYTRTFLTALEVYSPIPSWTLEDFSTNLSGTYMPNILITSERRLSSEQDRGNALGHTVRGWFDVLSSPCL